MGQANMLEAAYDFNTDKILEIAPGREPLLDVHTQMEMFRSYLEMAGDMACYCLYAQKGPGDEQSRIGAGIKDRLFFYGPVEDILGHPMEKLIGEFPDWPSLVHPEDWLDRKENQSAIYSNRAITCALECRILREDGQVRWIEEKVKAFFDSLRRTIHIQGVLRDITGRRRMEQNNERLRCILREQSANLRYLDDSRWKPRFKSEDFGTLSPSEMRVCELIAKGSMTKDIARMMAISPRTVESYRASIRKKLKIKNRRINLATYLRQIGD